MTLFYIYFIEILHWSYIINIFIVTFNDGKYLPTYLPIYPAGK